MTRVVVAILLMFLAACSPKQRWHDVSGLGRGYEDMRQDSLDCVGLTNDWQASTGKKLTSDEIFKRVDICMKDGQWAVED